MNIYDEFGKAGWTTPIASSVRDDLIPEIIRMVILAWLEAINKSVGKK